MPMRGLIGGLLLLMICFLLVVPQKCYGKVGEEVQDSIPNTPSKFDRELYQSLKSHPDFQYEDTNAGPEWSKNILNWLGDAWGKAWKWLLNGKEPVGFFSFLIQLSKYLSIVLLFGVIVWVIIKMDSSTKILKNKHLVQDDEVDGELIARGDFPFLIAQAIGSRDFALAIRYHYLYSLQLLVEKNAIEWESQKTNTDYLREIKDPVVQGVFMEITKWYHYFWFGRRPIDSTLFQQANKVFEQFKNVI
jgi:hypothetical protein